MCVWFSSRGDESHGARRQRSGVRGRRRKARRSAYRRERGRWPQVEPLETRSLLSAAPLAVTLDQTLSLASADAVPALLPLYYDYVENGVLQGGQFSVAPAALAPAARVAGVAGPLAAASAWNVTTVVNHGSASNRIDLAIVGDGYTTADLSAYATQVDGILGAFFAEQPLAEYASFFNVHRVDVISNESGVDNDPGKGVLRDTALDMGFWCGDIERALCVDVSKANAAARSAPAADTVLAVANSRMYGGVGYEDVATVAGANFAAGEVALHEFGHSFVGLADEYDYDGPDTYSGVEPAAPNVSIYDAAAMAAGATKWYRWLPEDNVDTFEGAMYSQSGIFRPTNNSKMRSLYRPFEQVNAEQFVLSTYQAVRPIDAATPPGAYTSSQVFFVDPVDPATHALDIQWSMDGNPIAGATGQTLDAETLPLTAGTHILAVTVVDNTPLVRDEAARRQWMTQGLLWIVTANAAPPAVVSRAPADNATGVRPPAEFVLTFNKAIQPGASGNIVLKVSGSNAVVETIPVTSSQVTVSGATATIVPSVTLAEKTGYYVEVSPGAFRDRAGNPIAGIRGRQAWNFTTGDFTPPAIVSLSPGPGAIGVAVGADLVLRFNEPIRKGLAGSAVVIRRTSDGALAEIVSVASRRVSVSGSTAKVNPVANLVEATGYYVEISLGAFQDTTGNFAAETSGSAGWNFTTGDFSPPAVLNRAPADNTAGVSLGTDLVLTFSENVVAGAAGAVTIRKSHDRSLVATIPVPDSQVVVLDATVRISLTTALAENTGYYVEVSRGALLDLSGKPFAGIRGTKAWNFTTRGVPPTVARLSPADGATDVAVDPKLVITFGESIRKGSSGSITVRRSSDGAVVQAIPVASRQFAVSDATATITLGATLQPGTGYYVEVSPAAFKDVAGNAFAGFAGPADWRFAVAALSAPGKKPGLGSVAGSPIAGESLDGEEDRPAGQALSPRASGF